MSSGVELRWGAFSVPHHGLALSIGYGGGSLERLLSPLHLPSLRLSQRIPHADSGDFGKTEHTLYLTP